MASQEQGNIDYNKLPKPIVKSLTELIARIKLILWIRGSLAILAVVVVAILIVMGIDAATIIISPVYRWALSSSVFIAFLIGIYFYLYRPLAQPFTLERVARFVELRHPELQERMSSIVELCRIDKNSDNFGSQRLIDKLAEEAVFDAKKVKPRQEINTKSVKPWFIAAGIVVGIIILLMAIWPLRTFRLMARVIAPASDVGSFFADSVEVQPGNKRMVKGDPLTIEVRTTNSKIDKAYIIKFAENGKLVKERMIESAVEPGSEENDNVRLFILAIPQVNDSFRYCIHAGHSVTEKYEVQAEIPPQVDRLDLIYSYPEYTGLGSVVYTNSAGNINVLNGTKVKANAYLSKPISSAKVLIAGKELAETNVTYTSQVRLKCEFDVPSNVDGKWQINIEDHFKFKNKAKTYSIVSVKDQAPTVDVFRPLVKDLTLSPKGRFVINYFAFDDYGLTNAYLEVTKDGHEPDIHQLKKLVKEKDKDGIWSGNVRFDLSKFDLKNVLQLSVVVCVADALPIELGGPQIAKSEAVLVSIDREAESLARQSYDMQHDTINNVLENVLKRLEDAVGDSKDINIEMSTDTPDYEQVDESATVVASDLSIVSELLDSLSGMLDETVYVGLKDGVEDAKTKGVDAAKQNAEMIVMLDKDDKKATGRKLRTSLEDSIMMIKNLFGDLEELDKVVEEWLETEELVNTQEDLAEDAEDMLEYGEMLDQDWLESQKDVVEDISDALAEEYPEAIKSRLEEVQKATEELAKDAEQLADIQDELAGATDETDLNKLEDALASALQQDDSSDKWDDAKEAAVQGKFDEAMDKAQGALDDDVKELVDAAKELETIGDMMTDNQALNDANREAADLAENAQDETEKASDMASDIAEESDTPENDQQNCSGATPEEQDAMHGQQEKAADALSDVSEGLEKSNSALAEQISALDAQIAAQAQANAQSNQPPMDTPMDQAMQAAMQAALDAQAAMDMENMEPSEAAQAQQAAEQAQSDALKAMNEAQKAQAEAMGAEPLDAALAQANAANAQADAARAQENAETAQAEAQGALDNQPQSAELSAAQDAQTEAALAQAGATLAQADAASAQAEAQDAMSIAAEAPSEEAMAAAQDAQAEAALAQAEAKAAQQNAQQTQSQASKATQQAEMAMMLAEQAMQAAQAAALALSEMMQQQSQQLGMNQQQMQAMASMNQPQPPSQQQSADAPPEPPNENAKNTPEKEEHGVIDLELLKNIGLTLGDWEKIKGGLKSGITSEGDFDNVPLEYRALVREYFREIAEQVQDK
jgi:hypothetical protein